ncbi:MAG: conjugal transfer protein [Oscillibacter sp.]|nr:conjugal transfer protein [Oscillibacter sp.]
MEQIEWVCCPACGHKTHIKIRRDTKLTNFPLYCSKCGQKCLIQVKNFQMDVIKEPEV